MHPGGGVTSITPIPLTDLVVGIKGAGEMATGVAHRLFCANIRRIYMMELPHPLTVRRHVAFAEAVHDGRQVVEGINAVRVTRPEQFAEIWRGEAIPVIVDPRWESVHRDRPDVLVDAILAKRNLGTSLADAPVVVGLGPGFVAGEDVHVVVATRRGHRLGRLIASGSDEPNTGIPEAVGGYTIERIVRAPAEGPFCAARSIGDCVSAGDLVGFVDGTEVRAGVGGVVRGLIRSGTHVTGGLKLGDVDPRGDRACSDSISDRARAIAGAVLEAILSTYNRRAANATR